MKTFHNQSNISLITKTALIFDQLTVDRCQKCRKIIEIRFTHFLKAPLYPAIEQVWKKPDQCNLGFTVNFFLSGSINLIKHLELQYSH
jgi:hypothetical protein